MFDSADWPKILDIPNSSRPVRSTRNPAPNYIDGIQWASVRPWSASTADIAYLNSQIGRGMQSSERAHPLSTRSAVIGTSPPFNLGYNYRTETTLIIHTSSYKSSSSKCAPTILLYDIHIHMYSIHYRLIRVNVCLNTMH